MLIRTAARGRGNPPCAGARFPPGNAQIGHSNSCQAVAALSHASERIVLALCSMKTVTVVLVRAVKISQWAGSRKLHSAVILPVQARVAPQQNSKRRAAIAPQFWWCPRPSFLEPAAGTCLGAYCAVRMWHNPSTTSSPRRGTRRCVKRVAGGDPVKRPHT